MGPPDGGIPSAPPSTPPPTGTRWEEAPVGDGCGRTALAWILVDEMCGGTDRADYAEAFVAPMFRDGVRIEDRLYAVDGSHLWVLDATDPTATRRERLVSGVGRPVAMAQHGGRLLLASVDEGLVIVEPADGIGLVRQRVALPGPALDVFVHADQALVAAGAAGLVGVDLSNPSSAVVFRVDVPGFAVGVAAAGEHAFVAACDGLVIVDLEEHRVVTSTWIPTEGLDEAAVEAVRRGSPAKRVAVVGDVAFVGAGRFGAVAVDVSSPEAPMFLGNCTEPRDLSFHGNGLRADGDRLYLAAGEWGILPIDVSDPRASCTELTVPTLYAAPPPSADDCSFEEGWELLPDEWFWGWAPPLFGWDPMQVLIAEGHLYAFGDASRVALRAIDIYAVDAAEPIELGLRRVGRYDEPRLAEGIAARDGRVLVAGREGGLLETVDDQSLLLLVEELPAPGVVAGGFLSDATIVLATGDRLLLPDREVSLAAGAYPAGLRVSGDTLVVPEERGAFVVELRRGEPAEAPEGGDRWIVELEHYVAPRGWRARLPPVAVMLPAREVVLAAPEWDRALLLGPGGRSEVLAAHGVFEAGEVLDREQWRFGPPTRVIVAVPEGIVEVASFGRRAGLVLHLGADRRRDLVLPAAPYVHGVADGGRLYLLAGDRRTYRSLLVTVDLGTDGEPRDPQILDMQAFSGVGVGLALDGGRLYVADADQGVRVFAAGSELPRPLGTVALGGTP